MGEKTNFEKIKKIMSLFIKRILVVIFVLQFNSFSLKAEIVNKIDIKGNSRVSDETVRVYGNILTEGSNYTKNNLDQILKDLYSTNFFKEINIEIKDNTLFIELTEYPVINRLIISGEKSNKFKDEIKKIISLKEKDSFIESFLSKDINIIKNLYSSLGYNFSNINPKIRKIDDRSLDLVFEIERGDITKISKISFSGEKKLRDKRLRDIVASQEDKFWKVISRNTKFSENLVNLDKRLLTNYYKSLGYYDVSIQSTSAELLDRSYIELNYTINAGERYIVDKISTKIDPVYDKKIFLPLEKVYKKVSGDYYSPFKVKKILEELDNLIERNSLQFAEHKVEEILEDGKISLIFDVREGEKVLVERINILGNSITKEEVIRSELDLDEGDPFTQLNLDKSISNLQSRKIFRTVDSSVSNGSSSDLKIIDIRVVEQPTGEISAGAGVGTEGGSFAFLIKENNWLGEGKQVAFDFEINAESVKGEFSYINPNYDLLGNSIRYNLTNVTNDKPDQGYENKLVSIGVGTGFEQYKDVFTNLSLNATYDDLRTTGSASDSLKKQAGEYSEIAASYGISYDRRNRKFMPTDGSIVSFNQTLPIFADKPFVGNTFQLSSYHSFNENFVGAGKFYLDTINGLDDEDVRISKRRSLSSKRLRGFERGKVGPVDGNDHVGGNYAAAINFEANLPNLLPDSSNAEVGFFLDFANVWEVDYDDSIDDSNELRSSLGSSLNWISPIGPLSFVLATNLSKASTDKTQSFSFNLGTSF
jgi:outer membrane protein insertion porin family